MATENAVCFEATVSGAFGAVPYNGRDRTADPEPPPDFGLVEPLTVPAIAESAEAVIEDLDAPQGRSGLVKGDRESMTILSDIPQVWPEAIVDIGPIEISAGYWGVVGLIPYDGHVVLEVIPTPPGRRGTRTRAGSAGRPPIELNVQALAATGATR